MRRVALSILSILAACGGAHHPAPNDPAHPPGNHEAPRGVEAAALPYSIVDARTGHAVALDEFWTRLDSVRAVCVGEEHPNPHHHWAQLQIVDGLSARGKDRHLALGMEMVQTPFQGVLDDYRSGAIDEATLLSRTGWHDRWGYDFALYRPAIDLARARGLALVALNAPVELIKRVSSVGVGGLTADERARLPQLVLDDAQHRAWFDGVMAEMGDHGGGKDMPTPDNMYAAQVVWDETMAESARRWLEKGGDAIVILAGAGHCHDSAIVRRLTRRGGGPAVSVRPIIDDGQGNVAAALAEAQNDYLFVMTMPAAK